MDELWFEEELIVDDSVASQIAQKVVFYSKAEATDVTSQIRKIRQKRDYTLMS